MPEKDKSAELNDEVQENEEREADEKAEPAALDDLEDRLKALENAEKAINRAYSTGKAERAKITQAAQLDAAEAVAMAGIAMESDEAADEAMRLTVITEKSGDRAKAREARKKERAARKKAKTDHAAATRSARKAYEAIKEAALEVYRAYGVRDLGRVDLVWDGVNAYVLEVDVSPGMTPLSLFPTACEAAGLSLSSVLDELVRNKVK